MRAKCLTFAHDLYIHVVHVKVVCFIAGLAGYPSSLGPFSPSHRVFLKLFYFIFPAVFRTFKMLTPKTFTPPGFKKKKFFSGQFMTFPGRLICRPPKTSTPPPPPPTGLFYFFFFWAVHDIPKTPMMCLAEN